MLVNEKTQFNTFLDSRKILDNYTNLSASLKQLSNSTIENETENYQKVCSQIENLIEQIKNA
jgi:hypothetical protein